MNSAGRPSAAATGMCDPRLGGGGVHTRSGAGEVAWAPPTPGEAGAQAPSGEQQRNQDREHERA